MASEKFWIVFFLLLAVTAIESKKGNKHRDDDEDDEEDDDGGNNVNIGQLSTCIRLQLMPHLRHQCGKNNIKEKDCKKLGCCYIRTFRGQACFKDTPDPAATAPTAAVGKTCQESYALGNKGSGVHYLDLGTGTPVLVYCKFNKKSGYMFPSKELINNPNFDIKNFNVRRDGFILLADKRGQFQSYISPLKRERNMGVTILQNSFNKFRQPKAGYGDRYLYMSVLSGENYQKLRDVGSIIGFRSSKKEIGFLDTPHCSSGEDNYFALYGHNEESGKCEYPTGFPVSEKFLKSFRRINSDFEKVMDNPSFKLALEGNFGNCGMKFALRPGCGDYTGFNVGFAFSLERERLEGTKCTCSGDPHCLSFDQKKFDFMGTCVYSAATDGCSGQPATFDIRADMSKRRPSDRVSWTERVIIQQPPTAMGEEIVLGKDCAVSLNGINQNSATITTGTGTSVTRTTDIVTAKLHNGLVVHWDCRRKRFTIYAPDSLSSSLCGLCGNFDGNHENDFAMGNANGLCADNTLFTSGEQATSANHFGNSWLALVDNDDGCSLHSDCNKNAADDVTCVPEFEELGKTVCGELHDPEGIFGQCLAIVDEVEADAIRSDCEEDICLLQTADKTAICSQVMNLAEACIDSIEDKDYSIVPFDALQHHCEIECGPNMKYRYGPVKQKTCSNPDGFESSDYAFGCGCLPGFLFTGEDCILAEECGCVGHDGQEYKVGDSYLDTSCQTRCTCNKAGGVMECTKADCAEGSLCLTENSKKVCRCPNGETEERRKGKLQCVGDVGYCVASGDPHYTTADRLRYSFQGTCSYVLVTDRCSGADVGGTFKITVDNYKKDPLDVVSLGRSATIHLYGSSPCKIEISLSEWPKDGVLSVRNLPHVNENCGVTITGDLNRGRYLATLPNGILLKVEKQGHYIRATLPSSLRGHTCGLCGNYNGDINDEFVSGFFTEGIDLQPNTMVDTVRKFAYTWIHELDDDVGCSAEVRHIDEVDTNCEGPLFDNAMAFCSAVETRLFNLDENFRRMDLSTLEPLRDNCVEDVCFVSEDREEFACSYAVLIVKLLEKELGVTITNWRNDDFCPNKCADPNAVALECGSHCGEKSCMDVSVDCALAECEEGCFCIEGFVWDGTKCIKPEACGCVYHGNIYRVGDTFLSNDCSEEYTCQDGGKLTSNPSRCHEHSTCGGEDGAKFCHCANGYEGSFDNCQKIDSTAEPCNALPDECTVVERSECVGYPGQPCGVGKLTEQRRCGPHGPITSVERKCCIAKCPPKKIEDMDLEEKADGPPGEGTPTSPNGEPTGPEPEPKYTCQVVYPYCDKNELRDWKQKQQELNP